MPHLPSRLAVVHLQTVHRLFDSNNHAGWKSLATAEIGSVSGQYRLGLAVLAAENWKPPERNWARLSPFYRNLLWTWEQQDGGRDDKPPEYHEDVCSEYLWGNLLIRDRENRPIYYPLVA